MEFPFALLSFPIKTIEIAATVLIAFLIDNLLSVNPQNGTDPRTLFSNPLVHEPPQLPLVAQSSLSLIAGDCQIN